MHDEVVAIMMDPRISLSYTKWWTIMHLGGLGLDELGRDSNGEETNQPLEEDY